MEEQERQEQQQAAPPETPPPPQRAAQPQQRRLYRSETNRVLGGVAGGMAEYFGWDPTLVRLVWAVATILGGTGLLVYVIMWMVTPTYSRLYGTAQPPRDPSLPPGTPPPSA